MISLILLLISNKEYALFCGSFPTRYLEIKKIVVYLNYLSKVIIRSGGDNLYRRGARDQAQ
jgi:hypothetical protein